MEQDVTNPTAKPRRGAPLWAQILVWAGLLAYNGFLYAILRRRDYLLYLIYMLSVGAFALTVSDVGSLFIR